MGGAARHPLRRFAKCRTGAAALEFAIVAPLLFAALLGTFETGRTLFMQNRLGAACAAAAREVAIKGASDETAIRNAILDKFSSTQRDNLTIALTDETISGQPFKKIDVDYQHELVVKLGGAFGSFTLNATRYAPAL